MIRSRWKAWVTATIVALAPCANASDGRLQVIREISTEIRVIERFGVVRFEFYRPTSAAAGSSMVRETVDHFAVTRQGSPSVGGWEIHGPRDSDVSEITYGEVPVRFT